MMGHDPRAPRIPSASTPPPTPTTSGQEQGPVRTSQSESTSVLRSTEGIHLQGTTSTEFVAAVSTASHVSDNREVGGHVVSTTISGIMPQQHMLSLPVSPTHGSGHAGLPQGSVSAPMSPDSPRYHVTAGLSHRAASVPSQVPQMGESTSPRRPEADDQSAAHIPNIVIDQVTVRDAFGHSRTPPFISSSWSSPWQLHIPQPRRQVRTNSDSALYDLNRQESQSQDLPSPLTLHPSHSVSSVSDAIHLEQIRITDSPCFSPPSSSSDAPPLGIPQGPFSAAALLTAATAARHQYPGTLRAVSSTSAVQTYPGVSSNLESAKTRAKSDSDTIIARRSGTVSSRKSGGSVVTFTKDAIVAMDTCSSPPSITSLRRHTNLFNPVDLPESKFTPTGSLFQRRFNPVPMEIGGDNGADSHTTGSGNHNNGKQSKPRISIETSETSLPQETRTNPGPNPRDKDREKEEEQKTKEHLLQVSQEEESRLTISGGLEGSSESLPHSPKTAWLRRHSDSNLGLEAQRTGGLQVVQEAQHRSHSTGETRRGSLLESVTGEEEQSTPSTPFTPRSAGSGDDWSSKRIKVKQYLTKRYELDLESPRMLLSIESDDVFSPSPGVFTKSKAFSFSPEREKQHQQQKTSSMASSDLGEGQSSSASSAGRKKVAREPLYIRTQVEEPEPITPLPGTDTEEVETPVFFSPAPTSSGAGPGYHSTVFQFITPASERLSLRPERSPLPMSPLVSGGSSQSRTSPSQKSKVSPSKSMFSPSSSFSQSKHSSTLHSAKLFASHVRQSEAALSSRDISMSPEQQQQTMTHHHFVQQQQPITSQQQQHPEGSMISLTHQLKSPSDSATRSPMETEDSPTRTDLWRLRAEAPTQLSLHAGLDTRHGLDSRQREKSPSSPRGESSRDHHGRQLPISPREFMPTIREHDQPPIVVKPIPTPASGSIREPSSQERLSSAYPPTPSSLHESEYGPPRTHHGIVPPPPSLPPPTMPGHPGAAVLQPLVSMLHHPSFTHAQFAAAAQMAAARTGNVTAAPPRPPPPFHSYLSTTTQAAPPGLQEMMQWAASQSTSTANIAPPPPPSQPQAPPPCTTTSTTSPHRTTSPRRHKVSPPSRASSGSDPGGGAQVVPGGGKKGGGEEGGGGVVKTLDASKIIYCPFSEEVKSQRYQQDPNQNFVCPVCGQMFPSFNYLANHMVNHLPSETITKGPGDGNKIHICKVCNKSFSRSDMLTRHMRLHTGLRPYECRICGQVFSRSDHLHTHNRTHTGEKPYRCPHCPYAAPRRDMITRHMRIHMKQWPKRGRRTSSTGSSDTPQSSSFSSSQMSGNFPHMWTSQRHESLGVFKEPTQFSPAQEQLQQRSQERSTERSTEESQQRSLQDSPSLSLLQRMPSESMSHPGSSQSSTQSSVAHSQGSSAWFARRSPQRSPSRSPRGSPQRSSQSSSESPSDTSQRRSSPRSPQSLQRGHHISSSRSTLRSSGSSSYEEATHFMSPYSTPTFLQQRGIGYSHGHFSSVESGECEGSVRRQSHSLSSMDSLESPGYTGSTSLDLPPAPRHSLSVLEHRSLDVEPVGRGRQWSVASGESYEASDERTPSTPGSATRFFTHQWQHPEGSTLKPPTPVDHPPPGGGGGVVELPPSSPKKRQWSEMSQTEIVGESAGGGEEGRGRGGVVVGEERGVGGSFSSPYAGSRDVIGTRGYLQYSTESTDTADTETTLTSVSSIGEASLGSESSQVLTQSEPPESSMEKPS